MKKIFIGPIAAVAAFAAIGCNGNVTDYTPQEQPAPPTGVVKQANSFTAPSKAGVEIKPAPDAARLWAEVKQSHAFSTRPDPFALQPKERSYEAQQLTERIFGQSNFRTDFVPQVEIVIVPEIEPQPYRRLAGVIVGDSVLALIDMGNGQLQLIHPGQEIDGWTVASIDGEKAILRRSGNKLPREVIVRLETPPPGAGGSGGVGGGGGGRPGRAGTQGPGPGPSGIGG